MPPCTMDALEAALARCSPAFTSALERRLAGVEPTRAEAMLFATGSRDDLNALVLAADGLRRQQAGEAVGYVINRNINFTNVCVRACKFCAFSRVHRSEEAYTLDTTAVVERARQAVAYGATEVCVQAGLPPAMPGDHYITLTQALHEALPALHLHAFSPEEVRYGSERLGVAPAEYLLRLRDAGLGSLPGTSAEILDDSVRRQLAATRISTRQWCELVTAAHGLGLRTTATMMFGHLERPEHWVTHLLLLRALQRETGGFTEFVPLAFVHEEAPLHARGLLPGVRPGPAPGESRRVFALSRVLLGDLLPNLQVSWVKHGPAEAAELLSCGANDLGGTLLNESISSTAGARHGEFMSPRALRALIRAAGRVPVQRDTLYRTIRRFEQPASDPVEPLDAIDAASRQALFGSYAELARGPRQTDRGSATAVPALGVEAAETAS